MTGIRYTTPVGSQGELHVRRRAAELVGKGVPSDCVCDSGCGIAPRTAIDEGLVPIPDYRVLWPGEPTTNAVWTAVEDCTRFEAFSEEGCATGVACAG